MSQNFKWSCAAWTEGGTEDDGTVPSMWINTEEKRLRHHFIQFLRRPCRVEDSQIANGDSFQ